MCLTSFAFYKNNTFDKFKEFVMLYKPIIEEKDDTLKNILIIIIILISLI